MILLTKSKQGHNIFFGKLNDDNTCHIVIHVPGIDISHIHVYSNDNVLTVKLDNGVLFDFELNDEVVEDVYLTNGELNIVTTKGNNGYKEYPIRVLHKEMLQE